MDAKALFNKELGNFAPMTRSEGKNEVNVYIQLYSACIIAEAITNNRDAICQSIDALTGAIKESGQ